jgi:hypothetical protein
MINVLILGAGGNAGINFAKSLKFTGKYKVIGIDISPHFFDTVFCDESYHMEVSSREAKIEFINEIVRMHDVDFIHAQPDPEVKFLCENKQFLNAPSGPHIIDEWLAFADKLSMQKKWGENLALQFKCEWLLDCMEKRSLFEEILSISGKVWVRSISGAGSKGALPVTSLEHAVFWADYWEKNRGIKKSQFMVAEYLPGREFAVQTVWHDGVLLHSQGRERLEYFFGSIMPSGQSSTPSVAKTVNSKKLYDVAYDAIQTEVKVPNGIYCVDLKENVKSQIIPLEVNYGRFFTTSDFFSSLGVNGPDAYVSSQLGYKVESKIESIEDEVFWVRGLDREPSLKK